MRCRNCKNLDKEFYSCKLKRVPQRNAKGAFFCLFYKKIINESVVRESAFPLHLIGRYV